MPLADNPRKLLEPLDRIRLEERLRDITREHFPDRAFDRLEMRYMSGLACNHFLLLADFYHEPTIQRILSPDLNPTLDVLQRIWNECNENEDPAVTWLRRLRAVPEEVRLVGDKCLFDVGLFGKIEHQGFNLRKLGAASYDRSAEILEELSRDRRLEEFFLKNKLGVLRLQDEVTFLKQCSKNFENYAEVLGHLNLFQSPEGEMEPVFDAAPGKEPGGEGSYPGREPSVDPESPGRSPWTELQELDTPASLRPMLPEEKQEEVLDPETAKLGHQEVLSFYERLLLFSSLNIQNLRHDLKNLVIDQPLAIDAICDDFSLFATGTHSRKKPLSYFFIGPTGVGKNLLVERLVETLEKLWGIQVPHLLIEGPSYTYPSDINELRGSTRGFIRSDEEGLLAEFNHRTAVAPFSVILVDEVEKAHSQLRKYFLSIMDRGTTTDNRGVQLNFASTMLVYTSNLGYSRLQQSSDPIGFSGADAQAEYQRRELLGDLKRELSPEFINRTRIIHFQPLSEDSIDRIFDLELEQIAERYDRVHGLALQVAPAARGALIKRGYSPEYGARHLSRVLNQVCNIGISKKLRQDSMRLPTTHEDQGLLAYIQEARKEERTADIGLLHRKVMERTRAKVPYREVVVDYHDGAYRYVTR